MNSIRRLLVVCTILLTIEGIAVAGEPCKPFEGGRVSPKLLETMREAARAGRLYHIVPGQSRVGFCVDYLPFQEFRGEFTNIVGGLTLPGGSYEHGQALLLIQATTMESNKTALNPLVQGHELMDTQQFPEILFVGRAFEWLAPQRGYIYGDITLHGRTRPVVFDIGIDILEDGPDGRPGRIYLRGTGQINRMRFEIRSHRFVVSEIVRLCLSVELALPEN